MKQFFLALFLLLLPTQFGLHIFFPFSLISGIRVDHLSLAFYLSDIIAFILFCIYRDTVMTSVRANKKYLLVFLTAGVVNALLSAIPLLGFYRLIKLIEIGIIYLIFKKSVFNEKSISLFIYSFLAGGIMEIFLSVMQIYQKSSIQGIFYFLGERAMTISQAGIAKASLYGVEFLRPYGTFSHPNSMAGFYLLVYVFFLTSPFLKKRTVAYLVVQTVCAMLVFISFSKIAIAVFILINGFHFLILQRDKCTSCAVSRFFILCFVGLIFMQSLSDPQSLQKRQLLFLQSFAIIKSHFFTGTGLGQYILYQSRLPAPYPIAFFEPVHSIIFLFFAESGVIFFFTTLFILWKNLGDKKILQNTRISLCLAVVLLTGALDHYWLTLSQNILLLGVIFGLLNRKKTTSPVEL